MPLYKLLEEMPYDELLGWHAFFQERPVGWRDDLRMVSFLRTQGVKEAPEKIFPSLSRVFNPPKKDDGKIYLSDLQGSSFFSNMLGAVGGDQLDVFKN